MTAAEQQQRMIERDIAGRGMRDPRVLAALAAVPRVEFIPDQWRDRAFDDAPLPLGLGQTISQPYIVGLMTEQLETKPTDRVLEIGTGSGYQAAVLARLVAKVFSVEIHVELADRARATLARLGATNVQVRHGDGADGWPEYAPFDKVIATCAARELPRALGEQLREGGLLVAPLDDGDPQTLYRYKKREGKLQRTMVTTVRFVPMTGRDQAARQ